MDISRRAATKLGLAGLSGALPRQGRAAAGYPDRPLRLVIPFSPGGPTDIVGRRYGESLSRTLGQPVVVDNRAGAAGAIGVQETIRAPKNGYTLMLGTSSTHVTTPATMPAPAYDVLQDLSHVAVITLVPNVIAVHPSVPARDLRELATLIRTDPDRYPYSSAGTGTISHLAGEMFQQQAGGLRAQHIPYRGSGPALQDVVGGTVPWFVDTFSTTLALHREGRVRIVGVCAGRRSAAAPEVPSAAEAGFPELICNTFNIVSGPAGLPDPVVERLAEATGQVMRDLELQAALREIGAEPVIGSGPAAARAHVVRERARWAPVIAATGLAAR